MRTRILVVDDDRGIADTLKTILETAQYECAVAYSAVEALQSVAQFQPRLVITDVIMPGMSGLELAAELWQSHPTTQVVFLSGTARTEELLAEAGETFGPRVVIAKPCPPRELLRLVGDLTRAVRPGPQV